MKDARTEKTPKNSSPSGRGERETAYLLKSETMKRRLLEAKERQEGISFEEMRKSLEFDA
jgi:hypothetical protein